MDLHRDALDAAIKAAGVRLTEIDRPLMQLARSLAAQVDAAGPGGPGTRLASTYLTTLRTLQTRMGTPVKSKDGKLAELRAGVAAKKPNADGAA